MGMKGLEIPVSGNTTQLREDINNATKNPVVVEIKASVNNLEKISKDIQSQIDSVLHKNKNTGEISLKVKGIDATIKQLKDVNDSIRNIQESLSIRKSFEILPDIENKQKQLDGLNKSLTELSKKRNTQYSKMNLDKYVNTDQAVKEVKKITQAIRDGSDLGVMFEGDKSIQNLLSQMMKAQIEQGNLNQEIKISETETINFQSLLDSIIQSLQNSTKAGSDLSEVLSKANLDPFVESSLLALGNMSKLNQEIKAVQTELKIAEGRESGAINISLDQGSIDKLSQEIAGLKDKLKLSDDATIGFRQEDIDRITGAFERLQQTLEEIKNTIKEIDFSKIGTGQSSTNTPANQIVNTQQEIREEVEKTTEAIREQQSIANQNGLSSVKEFYEKFGTVSEALDSGRFGSIREVLDELGGRFREMDETAEQFSERKVNAEFLKDLMSQLNLSEDKLTVIKALFKDIDDILPGGQYTHLTDFVTNDQQVDEWLNKIREITTASNELSQEEIENARIRLGIIEQIAETEQSGHKTPVSSESTEKATENFKELEQAVKQEEQTTETAVASEKDSLSSFAASIQEVIERIDSKTRVFQEEGQVVDGVVNGEVGNLQVLSGYLLSLKDDVEKLSSEFKGMNTEFKTDIETDNLTKFINSLSNIKQAKIGEKLGTIYKDLSEFANKVSVIKIDDNNILISINSLLTKTKELDNLANILKNSKSKIKEAAKATSGDTSGQSKSSISAKEYFETLTKYTQEGNTQLNRNKEKVNAVTKAWQELNAEQRKVSVSDYVTDIDADLDKIKGKLESWGNNDKVSSNIKEQIDTLKSTITTFQNSDFDLELLDENKTQKVLDSIKEIRKEFAEISSNKSLPENINVAQQSLDKLISKMIDFANKNTNMSGENQQILQNMIARARSLTEVDKSGINDLTSEFIRFTNQVKIAGQTGLSFFDQVAKRAKSMSASFIGMYFSLYDWVRYIRNAITTIKDLDTQLVDLRKTTTMSTSDLGEFYKESNNIAKQLGVTTSEIISQSSAWSRLGYNTKEASEEMAKMSSQFASISPGMDTEQAQSGLVSIMKAYDIEVEDAERSILDNVNTLGNRFAESNADIVDGMQRSAAALAATGTTLQESFALFTGGQEILQNAEKMGTALRSISMRIRGYNESTEEIDEELGNITGDLIDLTKTAEHSQGISIFKEGSTTEFKSLVEYLGEVSEIWDEMTDKQQNDFLQKAFAKTQAQAGAAIIKNFDQVKNALNEMENASGSADREMSIIEQSIDFKLNALKQTWVGVFQSLIDRGTLGGILDFLTAISDGIGKVTDKVGLLGTIGLTAGGIAGIQNAGRGKTHPLICFNVPAIISVL